MIKYFGGGFVVNFGYNLELVLDVIESLEDNCWIDDRIVVVFIECILFDFVIFFYSFMRYLYERFLIGGVIISGIVKIVIVYLFYKFESY